VGSGTGAAVCVIVQPPLDSTPEVGDADPNISNSSVRSPLIVRKSNSANRGSTNHPVPKPVEGGVHAPFRKAKEAAPPVRVPIQLGAGAVSTGALAELLRSKMRPSDVTEKELKIWVSGSYVNDPAVGRSPVPVKLIVYVVKSATSAIATGSPKAAIRSTLIPNDCFMSNPPRFG
jgi:hypothetical protein